MHFLCCEALGLAPAIDELFDLRLGAVGVNAMREKRQESGDDEQSENRIDQDECVEVHEPSLPGLGYGTAMRGPAFG